PGRDGVGEGSGRLGAQAFRGAARPHPEDDEGEGVPQTSLLGSPGASAARTHERGGGVRYASARRRGCVHTRVQGALRRGAGGVTRAGVGDIVDAVRSYRGPAMLFLHVGLATLGYPLEKERSEEHTSE